MPTRASSAASAGPFGLAVDAGHIYWANYLGNGTIGRANLDGPNVNQSFISGATSVKGVAISHAPSADPSPASLTFGSPTPVPKGTVSGPKLVTYTNHGDEPLVVQGFSFRGNGGDFFTTDDTCHAPIAPGSSCTVQIRFAPQAQGSRSATLTALTNAPSDPTTALTGTAGPLPKSPKGNPGKNAKVTCTVKKKGKTTVKVTCKVKLVDSKGSARVGWRLTRHGHTVAHGIARTRHGRITLPLSRIVRLHRGRYVLHVAGRRRGTVFVVG